MADIRAQLTELGRDAEGRQLGLNRWLEDPPLSVYVRWAPYWTGGEGVEPAIVIANVSVSKRGDGIFTSFLEHIEHVADENGRTVVIENVLEERFRKFFKRRGYAPRENGPAPVFVRLDAAPAP